jgi:hypothetical protein
MLVEECLELGTSWQIDEILSERRWKRGHKHFKSAAREQTTAQQACE